MQLISLASSSKGNCHLLQGNNEILILDCGISNKKLSEILKENEDKIVGMLITHRHNDHCMAFKGKKPLILGNVIYSNDETLEFLENVPNYAKIELEEFKQYKIGNEFLVLGFEVPHDVKNYAYIIYHKESKKMILYITDVGYVQQLKMANEFDTIIIEANYDEKWYENLEELSEGHLFKYHRLSSKMGHISIQQCIQFLKKTVTEKTKNIILVHVSRDFEEKNYIKFGNMVQEVFENKNVVAINNENIFERNKL